VDSPLPIALDGIVQDGVAGFAAIPYLERPLRVSSEAFGGAFLLDVEAWRDGRELRVALPGPTERTLRVEGAPDGLEVQVRPAGGPSYGVAPYAREGDVLTLRVPAGARVLLRAGDRWAATAPPEEGAEWIVPFAAFEQATRVRMPLRGARDGQVSLLRVEDGEAVLAQGLTRAVVGEEAFASVPPGRYRLAWRHSAGEFRHPTEQTMNPGQEMRVPLQAR
jgi:hypothetical protein